LSKYFGHLQNLDLQSKGDQFTPVETKYFIRRIRFRHDPFQIWKGLFYDKTK